MANIFKPINEVFQVLLDRTLTDKGKDNITNEITHCMNIGYSLHSVSIAHIEIKPKCLKSNGMAKMLNSTLIEKFYQIAIIKKVYNKTDKLQCYLDKLSTI